MVQPTPSQVGYPGQQADGRIVGVGEWFLMILVMAIPLVGLIMGLVWAFGNDGSTTKSNFFKAWLIWAVIGVVLSIIFMVAGGLAMLGMANSMNSAPPPGY